MKTEKIQKIIDDWANDRIESADVSAELIALERICTVLETKTKQEEQDEQQNRMIEALGKASASSSLNGLPGASAFRSWNIRRY